MAKTSEPTIKAKVIQAVFVSLATGGFIALAMAAPNALGLLGPFVGKSKRGLFNRRYYVKSTISRLAKQGFIVFKKSRQGKVYARLTSKGKRELLKYKLEKLIVHKPWRWDGKWRVVIYDIREFRRRARHQLRQELINLGFTRLQNSVWVYPYDCDEFITLLKTYYGLGRSLLYLVVDKLEDDLRLKKMFEL